MTYEEIRLELFRRRKGAGNMALIARGLDPPVTRQAVAAVVERSIASYRIACAVSKAIEKDPKLVFPEYFTKKKKRGRKKTKGRMIE